MKKTCFIGIMIFLAAHLAPAQDVLTLNAAIEIGLANNYGINIAKNSLRIAGNNATPGNAGMLPRIDVNAAYAHGYSNAKQTTSTGSSLDNPNASSDLFTAGVNLNWTLFDGLKMFITYDKLKKLEEIGDLGSKIAIENTLAQIMGAYYDIIRQSKETAIMQEQVDISNFRLELAKLKYEQ